MFAFLKRTLRRPASGFLLIALFIWFAGPYFAFADYRPLETAVRAPDRDRRRRGHLAAAAR